MHPSAEITSGFTYAPRAPRLGRPPFWMVALAIAFTLGSWVPIVFFAKARVSKTPEPPINLMQDMFTQPKYREQQSNDSFADGRAMRPRVEGTVGQPPPMVGPMSRTIAYGGMLDED